MDLHDWHERLEVEAKLAQRTQEHATPQRKIISSVHEALLFDHRSEVPARKPSPPRQGRGPRRIESREELLARLLDPTLTLDEAARVLEVCPTTVRRWTNKGLLVCDRSAGNQRRFKLSAIEHFLRSRSGTTESTPVTTERV